MVDDILSTETLVAEPAALMVADAAIVANRADAKLLGGVLNRVPQELKVRGSGGGCGSKMSINGR